MPDAPRVCCLFDARHCSHTVNLDIMWSSRLVRLAGNLQFAFNMLFAAISNLGQKRSMEVVSGVLVPYTDVDVNLFRLFLSTQL